MSRWVRASTMSMHQLPTLPSCVDSMPCCRQRTSFFGPKWIAAALNHHAYRLQQLFSTNKQLVCIMPGICLVHRLRLNNFMFGITSLLMPIYENVWFLNNFMFLVQNYCYTYKYIIVLIVQNSLFVCFDGLLHVYWSCHNVSKVAAVLHHCSVVNVDSYTAACITLVYWLLLSG